MVDYIAALSINNLRLSVRLGVGEGERERPQAVELNARFYFEELSECAINDESQKFICYDSICNRLLNYVDGKEFRFLEYLTMDLHRVIHDNLEEQLGEQRTSKLRIWLQIRKLAAPVPYMTGGAEFTYSDIPSTSNLVEVA